MSVPSVVIVGRPNVGKSSLLNWLAQRRVSVVDPTAGVTRDRVTFLMHEHDRYFELVDTGGMGFADVDDLTQDVEHQIDVALDTADVILLVVDARTGMTPLDRVVAERLRRVQAAKLLVVNKCDTPRLDDEVAEFFSLADAPLVRTSVTARRNRDELLEQIVRLLPPEEETERSEGAGLLEEPELKLAIVGRRNVGKSTFINALAQAERMIVSEIAGTTRDSVDVRFELDGKSFVAIDTPGVRKRKSLANDIEYYGLVRAKSSIRRADLVMMFFDATDTISRVDKQLVSEIEANYKPCILVVNKWDRGLEKDMTSEKWAEYLYHNFPGMRHAPIGLITAQTGRNVKQLINLAQSIFKQSRERVPTAQLNRVIREALDRNPPRYKKNRRPKIFYGTQVAVQPPTIVLKCNDPTLFDAHWKRFLLGVFREHLPFEEVPIKLYFRGKEDREETGRSLDEESQSVTRD
jgi:GTPase